MDPKGIACSSAKITITRWAKDFSRSLSPLDYETISKSVIKTHRALILHEDTLVGGIDGEISGYISEHLFKHLDAPVVRVGNLDTAFPFDKGLEAQYLANNQLTIKLEDLLSY